MTKAKVIFHIDMNSFYASVEMAHDPSLKGKPIAIAGNPQQRKGIIVTSSYEARAKGVQTTMTLWEAKKLCPDLIVIRPNFDRYREMSSKIFRLLSDVTERMEPVSIDEGYLDVSEVPVHPVALAYDIQKTILNRLDIPCSIGIAPNKFLAKTASDMKKPLGITVLRKREIKEKLWPLPVEAMYGVGNKTAEKLRSINIFTIEDLAKADDYVLNSLLGLNGERLKQRANGIDHRQVDPDAIHDFKSIGNSETLPEDTEDEKEIHRVLLHLTERVSDRLKRRSLTGKTIQLMIRYSDRKTITRSKKITSYVQGTEEVFPIVDELFQDHWNLQPVRLLGVTVSDLLEEKDVLEQLSLFTYKTVLKKSKRDETLEALKKKFGDETFPTITSNDKKTQEKLLRTSFQKDFLDDFRT